MSKRAILLLQKNTWWMLTHRNYTIWKLHPLRLFGLIVLAAHNGPDGELFFIEFLQKPIEARSWLYRYLRNKIVTWVVYKRKRPWHTATRVQHVVAIIKKYEVS